jgi:hypothetical protein
LGRLDLSGTYQPIVGTGFRLAFAPDREPSGAEKAICLDDRAVLTGPCSAVMAVCHELYLQVASSLAERLVAPCERSSSVIPRRCGIGYRNDPLRHEQDLLPDST